MPVKYNKAEAEKLEHLDELPDVVARLSEISLDIVRRAQQLCPRRTGGLAESIHAELSRHPTLGMQARISWDRDHFYGWMVEAGTTGGQGNGEGTPPRPFLRPAAAKYVESDAVAVDLTSNPF
jgi:hypothetical protein